MIEGKRIINKVQNTNEITAYLSSRRHLDYFVASQELNNLYMKNKNEQKIQYMFGEKDENKAGFSLTGLKNLIMDKSELNEEKITSKDIDAIRDMKDCLYSFSTTNTGVCNALIFLGEKNNINDEFDTYNFNPWKGEWIYTPQYKKKRKEMIHQIRSSMDYRGEISDDEDSIVKFDDKKDFVNERIKQLNDIYLKKKESVIKKEEKVEEEKPMINNAELTTGEVDNNNLNESKNTILSHDSSKKKTLSETNQRFSIKNIFDKNNNRPINKINNDIGGASEIKILTDTALFPRNGNIYPDNYNVKK